MKTSNKLLIALFTLVLFAIVGTNLILKAEYEKIDLHDPFYGYSMEKVAPYNVVALKGNGYGLIQIQQGKNFQVRVKEKHKNQVNWILKHDTLELSFMPERPLHQFDQGDPFIFPAEIYIIVPEISSVLSENVRTRLTELKEPRLTINHEGPEGWVFLQNNSFDSVFAGLKEGGLLKIGTNNEIQHMVLGVSSYSSFEAEKDVFQSIEITADSLANLKLPAALLKEIGKGKIKLYQ